MSKSGQTKRTRIEIFKGIKANSRQHPMNFFNSGVRNHDDLHLSSDGGFHAVYRVFENQNICRRLRRDGKPSGADEETLWVRLPPTDLRVITAKNSVAKQFEQSFVSLSFQKIIFLRGSRTQSNGNLNVKNYISHITQEYHNET